MIRYPLRLILRRVKSFTWAFLLGSHETRIVNYLETSGIPIIVYSPVFPRLTDRSRIYILVNILARISRVKLVLGPDDLRSSLRDRKHKAIDTCPFLSASSLYSIVLFRALPFALDRYDPFEVYRCYRIGRTSLPFLLIEGFCVYASNLFGISFGILFYLHKFEALFLLTPQLFESHK